MLSFKLFSYEMLFIVFLFNSFKIIFCFAMFFCNSVISSNLLLLFNFISFALFIKIFISLSCPCKISFSIVYSFIFVNFTFFLSSSFFSLISSVSFFSSLFCRFILKIKVVLSSSLSSASFRSKRSLISLSFRHISKSFWLFSRLSSVSSLRREEIVDLSCIVSS